jgi:hypothetical protein
MVHAAARNASSFQEEREEEVSGGQAAQRHQVCESEFLSHGQMPAFSNRTSNLKYGGAQNETSAAITQTTSVSGATRTQRSGRRCESWSKKRRAKI